MRRGLLLGIALFAGCATAPPPPPPAPPPSPAPAAPVADAVIGSVRVNATALNVRSDPSMNGEIITHAKKGEKLDVLAERGDWLRVRLADGSEGWVSAQHVMRDGASAAKPRRSGCPSDSDYAFAKNPMPVFSDSGAHGMVTVEANVDSKGNVTSTKMISNTTGDESLGFLTEREIRAAKFIPPVRECVPKAFIFTYKRSF